MTIPLIPNSVFFCFQDERVSNTKSPPLPVICCFHTYDSLHLYHVFYFSCLRPFCHQSLPESLLHFSLFFTVLLVVRPVCLEIPFSWNPWSFRLTIPGLCTFTYIGKVLWCVPCNTMSYLTSPHRFLPNQFSHFQSWIPRYTDGTSPPR